MVPLMKIVQPPDGPRGEQHLTSSSTPRHTWSGPCESLSAFPRVSSSPRWRRLLEHKHCGASDVSRRGLGSFGSPPAAGALPMSPFSMARMSGLSLQSVRGSEASISVCSSLSCIAKEVKLYICSTRISQHPRTTLEFTQRQFQDLNNASHRRLERHRTKKRMEPIRSHS